MRFVVSLGHLDQDDLATAGGKAANLGQLVRAGFPVPDGFVVTTDAYAMVIQPLDLNIPERAAGGEGASVRTDIEQVPMPTDLRTEIANAYAALGAGRSRSAPAPPPRTCQERPLPVSKTLT